jgi:release factor glutamine methyltransferase
MTEPVSDTFAAGRRLADRHGTREGRPAVFETLDMQWDLLPGVFAPVYTASTEIFTTWLPFPRGGSFLEVGSGTGVTAVWAALEGCAQVTALDVTQAAVCNTEANVRRHGVADRVRVLHSDLFDALRPHDRFDVIFWNSNVVEAPKDFVYSDDVQAAIFDPGYAAHARYLREGPGRLTRQGRLFLGFNSLGNGRRLKQLAAVHGLRVLTRRRISRPVGDFTVDFMLLELVRRRREA